MPKNEVKKEKPKVDEVGSSEKIKKEPTGESSNATETIGKLKVFNKNESESKGEYRFFIETWLLNINRNKCAYGLF